MSGEGAATKEIVHKPETDAELAQTWLQRETEETNKRVADATHSIKFYSTYQPTPISRPSWVEKGSMDDADWTNAELEDQNWEAEREERLDDLSHEQDDLYEKRSELYEFQQRLASGSAQTIAELAGREKARRKALTEQERIEKERREGVRFEGTEEVAGQLKTLGETERKGAWKKGSSEPFDLLPTPNGWRKYYDLEEGYTYGFGKAALGNPQIIIRLPRNRYTYDEGDPDIVNVHFEDLSRLKAQRTTIGATSGLRVESEGLGLWFKVDTKKNLIIDHSASGLRPGVFDPGDTKVRSTGKTLPMTQGHFDSFRSHLNSLVGGVQSEIYTGTYKSNILKPKPIA